MIKYTPIVIGLLFTSLFSVAQNAVNQGEIVGDSIKEKARYLDEVVVTGTLTARTLKNTPILTRVISENDIRQAGATTVLEALENFVPGVNFTPNPMGDNIRIAGLENNYILVLVDGERLVNERTENVNFSRLNTCDIKRIEIINGASSVLYGSNAIGAVINVITKDADKSITGLMRLRYSNYNSSASDASIGFKISRFSSKTVLSAKNSDGYTASKPDENGKTSFYTMYPYSDYTLSQVFKYRQEKWNAELKGNYYRSETWFLHKYQTRRDKNYTLGGKLQYVFSKSNTLTFTGNRDSYDGYQIYKRRNDSADYVNGSKYTAFRLTDVWNVTDKIQFVSGAELNLENTFSYNQFGFAPAEKNASNRNLFTQGEFKTETGLEALIGVRYTNHSQFGGYLSPKISLMYRLENFRFRANISNGYKAPTLKEMYMNFPHKTGEDIPFYVIGNADLLPEEAWYKSISAEYIADNLNLSVTAHDNAIKNRINTSQVWNEALSRTEMRYENIAEAQITGADVSLQWNFLKNFQLKGGYSFANAVDKATNRQLSGNCKHSGTVSLTYQQTHLPFLSATETPYSLLLSARVMSPRIIGDIINDGNGKITETFTDSYFISRFVYTQQFPVYKQVQGDLQVGINNLLNYTNHDYLSNSAGRTCFVSLGIRF